MNGDDDAQRLSDEDRIQFNIQAQMSPSRATAVDGLHYNQRRWE